MIIWQPPSVDRQHASEKYAIEQAIFGPKSIVCDRSAQGALTELSSHVRLGFVGLCMDSTGRYWVVSVCPVCDHENMPGMVFCTACGYRMDEGEPEGSRPSDGHSTVHLSDDSNDGEHGVEGTISDAATSHPVSDSANATEEPTKSGRRKIDPDSDAESEENSTQQPSTLSESETNNPLEGCRNNID